MAETFKFNFFGIKRNLPVTYISRNLAIANFNILGDIEITEKAGELLEKRLKDAHIIPKYFVGPEVKIVPFVHHMAKRFHHKQYVILRKSVRGYMQTPTVETPTRYDPKHVKKIVISGKDKDLIKGKKVVLIDDVISTGATMRLAKRLLEKVGAQVIACCALIKQGDQKTDEVIYLATLPIFKAENKKLLFKPLDK